MGMIEDDIADGMRAKFEQREPKVHLFEDNAQRKNRLGGPVDNTLCRSNHGSAILTTNDRAKVTCKRCLKRIHLNYKGRPMGTVKQGSLEHLDIVRAPLKAQIEELGRQVYEAIEEKARLEQRNAMQETTIRGLLSDVTALKEDSNDLRSRLMASELAYAKLHGYLAGRRDAEPPRMVPEQREPFYAQMPDGSFGTASLDWRQNGAGGTVKHWYHR